MAKVKLGYPNQASGYPFTEDEIDGLMTAAWECALNWTTEDGWPVGVMHLFVWHEAHVWLSFMSHRHRAAAIRRDPRVSIIVTSSSAPPGSPQGQATMKGRAVFHDDVETVHWFYRALGEKSSPDDPVAQDALFESLDSPLRTVLEVIPEKWITFDTGKMLRDKLGTLDESERGELLPVDTVRMQAEIKRRGLEGP
ncbi:MAG: pyridoxamine 5'-phosphate oxidase family protein [Deltaproteobacteria bacterium]|nr:pyridoxamine 5'-phosphate oxidase family protein [Deltaproteobacteria bacterium]